MVKKIDGVKISVNNDAVSDSSEKARKEIAQKKTASKIKKVAPRKTSVKRKVKPVTKKEVSKKELEKSSSPKTSQRKKKGGFFRILTSIGLTALVVGGIMYAWQDKVIENVEEEAGDKTETLKLDLEKRLSNLKSKITGVETTNVELKKTLEEFKKKAELLIGSKKEYKNDDLGLSFEYPASFGTVQFATTTVASSTIINMTFENNEKLVLAGVQDSYKKLSTSSPVSMSELKGFVEKRKKFYLLGPNDAEEFEVKPAQVIIFDGGEAILLDKNSFVVEEDGDGIPVDIGDNVAFVFNLEKKEIPGLVIINSDFSMLPLNDFVLMMESFGVN